MGFSYDGRQSIDALTVAYDPAWFEGVTNVAQARMGLPLIGSKGGVTVRDRMLVVMDLLEENETVEFMRIFESPGEAGGVPSRPVLVATFLAILELARLSALRIYQGISERGTPEGAIRVRRAQIESDSPEWRERITETM